MSEIITVQRVETRPQPSKFSKPGVPSYVYEVYGTNGQKYEHGFKDPKVAPGETITAEIDYTKYGPKITSFTRGSLVSGNVTIGSATPAGLGLAQGSMAGGITTSPPLVIQHTPVRDGFLQGSRPFPLPTTHGDRSFVRQHALTQAVLVLTGTSNEVETDAVIEMARKFEAYCSGQDDLLAAEKIVAAQTQMNAAVLTKAQQYGGVAQQPAPAPAEIQEKLKAYNKARSVLNAQAVPGNE